jgi:hypothetical protein
MVAKRHKITNVPLFKKIWDIIFFWFFGFTFSPVQLYYVIGEPDKNKQLTNVKPIVALTAVNKLFTL